VIAWPCDPISCCRGCSGRFRPRPSRAAIAASSFWRLALRCRHVGVRCEGKQADPRRESPLVLAAGAVKIGILVVATVVFIVVYGLLSDFLQRRGP
jgi:hypothetical protein